MSSSHFVTACMYRRGAMETLCARMTGNAAQACDRWIGLPVRVEGSDEIVGRVVDQRSDEAGALHVVLHIWGAAAASRMLDSYVTTTNVISARDDGRPIWINADVFLCTESLHGGATKLRLMGAL
jgi:hypothetical protein